MARDIYPPPLSKTAKYKKITKPLLERKRRARINRCLDELKDLMVGALEIDDDNMSKLEKADILELTVNHLTKLHSPRDPVLEAKKFQAGFGQCAAEACRFILGLPDLDSKVSENLVNHLSRLVSTQPLSIQVPGRQTYSPPVSPPSPVARDRDRHFYYSHDEERSSSDGEDNTSPYDDRYPDDVSQYSASSNWSQSDQRIHNLPIKTTPSAKDLDSPMSGLLTTVDRVHSPPKRPEQYPLPAERGHRGSYFNRVPAECKDVILQKIRQHIMDKRGNETNAVEVARVKDNYAPRIPAREALSRNDGGYGCNQEGADTLDLRKVRTPSKVSPVKRRHADSPPIIYQNAAPAPPPPPPPRSPFVSDKLQHVPIANKPPIDNAEPVPVLPEQLAVDYSNLPPKKKRKLLEYQEYKKQEESRRLDEIARQRNEYLLINGHPENGEVDVNNPAWRPW